MTKCFKKLVSLVLTLTIFLSMCYIGSVSVSATSQRDNIISIARSETGYHGRPNTFTYWYGSLSGYADGGYNYPWCAAFVSWCANQAGISTDIIPKHSSCTIGMNWFKDRGLWEDGAYYGGSYTPKAGDIVYYSDNYNQNVSSHVGIVTGLNGNYLTVIEGNTDGNRVTEYTKNSKRTLSNGYVLGYGTPEYGDDYVDLGTDFYAYIINTGMWKHLTNDGPNVSIRTETGNANQVWYFERQNDGSYKITNCEDNLVLDDHNLGTTDGTNVAVAGSNDCDAQRWYVKGHSGEYYISPKCAPNLVLDVYYNNSADGTNVQLWTNYGNESQKFQIWKLDKPGKATINITEGTNYTPTTLSWNQTTDTICYDIYIWKGTAWESERYQTIWSVKDTSCTINLPSGYYEACVAACNNFSYTMGDAVGFYIQQDSPVDIGDNIYACFLVSKTWVNLSNINSNAVLEENEHLSPRQIWNFQRQSDGSYVIINCADGKALDVTNAGTENGTNVQLCEINGSDAQKWYIYGRWSGEYYLKPKCADKVLDIFNGEIQPGGNVQIYELNYTDAQKFAIYQVNKAGNSKLTVKSDTSVTNTEFTWTEATDATEYVIKIYKNESLVTDYTTTDLSYNIKLTAGNYKACIIAKNSFSSSTSEFVSFTVEQGLLLGDTNLDGTVSVDDVTYLQMHLARYVDNGKPLIDETDETTFAIADLDGDGALTINDATVLQMALAGIK